MSAGYIELDGRRHEIARARLRFEGTDFSLELSRPGEPPLWLAGEARGDRLRLDLRSLDEVLAALLGYLVTVYPGGANVCEAFLDVRAADGGGMLLSTDVELDWDRAIDPPGVEYPDPRRLKIELVATH